MIPGSARARSISGFEEDLFPTVMIGVLPGLLPPLDRRVACSGQTYRRCGCFCLELVAEPQEAFVVDMRLERRSCGAVALRCLRTEIGNRHSCLPCALMDRARRPPVNPAAAL